MAVLILQGHHLEVERHFTGIVSFEPIVQIVGMADVVVLGIVHTPKDIDI